MTYLARRLALFVLTLLLISVMTFAITNVLPGDVATMILGTRSNPVTLAALRQTLGLNQPLVAQYGHWVGQVIHGDLGVSLIFKEPIALLLGQKITASSMLVVMSLIFAVLAAVPLGVWSAVHHDRWQDTLGSGIALAGDQPARFLLGHHADPPRSLAGSTGCPPPAMCRRCGNFLQA